MSAPTVVDREFHGKGCRMCGCKYTRYTWVFFTNATTQIRKDCLYCHAFITWAAETLENINKAGTRPDVLQKIRSLKEGKEKKDDRTNAF